MKFALIGTAAALSVATVMGVSVSADASTQSFKSLVKKAKKVKRTAEEVEQAAEDLRDAANSTSRAAGVTSSAGSSSGGSAGRPGLPGSGLTSMSPCLGLPITNVMLGDIGSYTYGSGMRKETSDGFINRQQGAVTGGCILPSMAPGEYMYLEVPAAQYKAAGSANDWEMQCVDADTKQQIDQKGEMPYRIDFIAPKHMEMQCGNSEGVSQCTSGSNNDRATAYSNRLKKSGKMMLGLSAYKISRGSPQTLYCHWYNKKQAKALFAFQYRRVKG